MHFVKVFEQRVVKQVQLRRKPPIRTEQRLRSCFRARDNPCYMAGAKLRDEDFRLARKSQMQMKQGRTAREPCRQNACRQTARAIDVNQRNSPPANDCGELYRTKQTSKSEDQHVSVRLPAGRILSKRERERFDMPYLKGRRERTPLRKDDYRIEVFLD